MTVDNPSPNFGCPHCMPDSPEAAWKARLGFAAVANLVEESHFSVRVLACPQCAQHFVSVFCETIDWKDGDDPQFWSSLPLTADESRGLIAQGSRLSEAQLNALPKQRRCLNQDNPKGSASRSEWSYGLWVRAHD